jgi:hypothetical protein
MSKHTPGPWHAQKVAGVFRGDLETSYAISQTDHMPHATVFARDGHGGDTEEAKADARLIASAPELLLACKAMLTAQGSRRHPLGDMDEGIATICAKAASMARSAIEKAEGTPCGS